MTDKDTALSSQLIPQGYNITIANRSIPCRGGGLALIYSSKLKLVSTTIPSFSSCEMMICNLKFPSSCTIYFVLIYRPPSSSITAFLVDLTSIFESISSDNTIILGDFNIQYNRS